MQGAQASKSLQIFLSSSSFLFLFHRSAPNLPLQLTTSLTLEGLHTALESNLAPLPTSRSSWNPSSLHLESKKDKQKDSYKLVMEDDESDQGIRNPR